MLIFSAFLLVNTQNGVNHMTRICDAYLKIISEMTVILSTNLHLDFNSIKCSCRNASFNEGVAGSFVRPSRTLYRRPVLYNGSPGFSV